MNALRRWFTGASLWIRAHKWWSVIIVVLILGGGYLAYAHYAASNTASQYVIAPAMRGTLTVTVTGSGQVAANQSIDLSPKASGEITSVNVKAGDVVAQGATIATIDDTTALQSLRDAEANLQSAQIAYQQSLMSTQTSDTQAKGSAFSTASSALTDVSSILKDLNDALFNQSAIPEHTDQQYIDAYASIIGGNAGDSARTTLQGYYNDAQTAYQNALSTATGMSPDSSDTDIQNLIDATYAATKSTATLAGALHDTMTNVNDALTSEHESSVGFTNEFTTVTNDSSKINTDVSNAFNAQQTLASALATGTSGTTLDVQSAELTLQKAQNSVDDAKTTLADYFVTAPFSGTIAKVDVQTFDQGSSGTTVATLVTNEEYADLSLNEVDAAKVQDGQKATLTFDAIDGLTLSGTIEEVDSIGTVSQGVVTYDVKISFDTQDARVKPGMTVNATITTNSVANATIVPSSAVTTVGNQSFVQIVTQGAPTSANGTASTTGFNRQHFASSTSQTGFDGTNTTTPRTFGQGFASSTGRFGSSSTSGFMPTQTVDASSVTVMRVPVVIGVSNDTQTQILSGVMPGTFVVVSTKSGTTSGSTSTSATTNRPTGFGGGGGARAFGG